MGGTVEGKTYMRFIVGSGQQLRNRLETFPEEFRNDFASSKILVICVTSDNEVVGACSILKTSNYGLSYIKENYRGRGLGTKCARIRIHEARRRGLDFVATAIELRNLPMLRIASKAGYREVARFRDFGYVLLMIPLNFKGELLYALLHGVCSKLPRVSLHATILVLMSVVGLIRRRLSVG